MFSLKPRNKNEQTICTNITVKPRNSVHIHLKFNNKLVIFFSLFKDLAYTETYEDHDVINYLHHTVVTTVDSASPPSCDSLPNLAVNKARTVQTSQEQQVWNYYTDIMIQDLLCTINSDIDCI